jgi:hypothetical protein
VDRKQKKSIHLRITQLLDNHCKRCEFRSIYNSHLHCNSNCPIGKELKNCSNTLLGKPIIEEPVEDENNGPLLSGRWSDEEVLYLLNHAHIFKIEHLARRLNRSYKDVYNKLWRFKQERKISISLKRKGDIHGLSS